MTIRSCTEFNYTSSSNAWFDTFGYRSLFVIISTFIVFVAIPYATIFLDQWRPQALTLQ